ncbi:hypothetical protein KJ611_01850 [Patescibacteria group bacterium]|nr:hypothetical protein [Patescibacteria group bacterium]MBU1705927.1 hypothetical protein [Patescibacteria group bacterium]
MAVETGTEKQPPVIGEFEGFELVSNLKSNNLISRPWSVSGTMATPDGTPTTLLTGDMIHYDMEKRWISVIRNNQRLIIISLIDGEQKGFLEYLSFSSVVVSRVFTATMAIISAVTGLSLKRMDKPLFPGIAYRVMGKV